MPSSSLFSMIGSALIVLVPTLLFLLVQVYALRKRNKQLVQSNQRLNDLYKQTAQELIEERRTSLDGSRFLWETITNYQQTINDKNLTIKQKQDAADLLAAQLGALTKLNYN